MYYKYPERDVRMALLTRLHQQLLATRAHCPEPRSSTPDHFYFHILQRCHVYFYIKIVSQILLDSILQSAIVLVNPYHILLRVSDT